GPGQFPHLICLGQDNRWYVVAVADVIDLHDQFDRLTAVETLSPPADLPLKPGQSRSGDEQTAALAQQIPQPPDWEAAAPEVQAQRSQVAAVEAMLKNHPAQSWQNPTALLKRQKQLQRLEVELSDRRAKLSTLSHRYWQEFLDLMSILQHFGCLQGVKPMLLGEIAAAVRGDNELWLGLALATGEFDQLEAPYLAAACAALVTENSRPDSWVRYQLSPVVEEALGGLRGLRRDIFKQQRRHQMMLPVWLEYELTALVEQWAHQTDWNELCDQTSLDEGDIVRILRRTLDFLSQIPHIPHLSPQIVGNAREAIALLNRFPINESLT
ncbi:MAG: RNA helicase, partial [Leptolyngbya sp. SIO4C5]|nr:RNA helicase [Leptolyngbya sp. SIO4C5]